MSDERNVLRFDPRRRRERPKEAAMIEIPFEPGPVRRLELMLEQGDREITLTSFQHPPGYREWQGDGWFEPYDQDLLGTDRWPILRVDTDHGGPRIVDAWERSFGRTRIWSWMNDDILLYDPDAYARMSRRYPYATFVREIREAMEAGAAFEEEIDLKWLLKCPPGEPMVFTFASAGHIIEYQPAFSNDEDTFSARIHLQPGWPDGDALRFAIEEYGTIGISGREMSSLEEALHAHIINRQPRR